MISKIEIDGFKSFRKFQMEFSPLTVVAGTNASGKSNLFDALSLLSKLAETDLKTAFSEQRGEPGELFTKYDGEKTAHQMSFAVEMLLNRHVKDNWGGEIDLKYTRLRYELVLKRVTRPTGMEDLEVVREQLENLKHNDDDWVMRLLPPSVREFWRPKVPTGRRSVPYIETEEVDGIVKIRLPQDGTRGGNPTPASAIGQTVLSGINSVDFPHALAAKEEMRSWKFLQLNPQALREPTRQDIGTRDKIKQTGENLAAALFRIKINDPFALKDISRKLNSLLPGLTEVNVYDDKANKQYIIKVKNEDGQEFSSRVLSEGTLRLLTLCIFQFDPQHSGLLCFEEPENGIHPARMGGMVKLLKELGVDFEDENSPLRQVIVNTHSPGLLYEVFQLQDRNASVWFSQLATQIAEIDGVKTKFFITKMLPVDLNGNSNQFTIPYSEIEKRLTLAEVKKYLQNVDSEKTILILN